MPAGTLPAEAGDEAQPTCSILIVTPATPLSDQAVRKTTAGADSPFNEPDTFHGDLCQKHLESVLAENLNALIKVTDVLHSELPMHLPRMWHPLL